MNIYNRATLAVEREQMHSVGVIEHCPDSGTILADLQYLYQEGDEHVWHHQHSTHLPAGDSAIAGGSITVRVFS
jgi:hypothetical protein